MTPRHSQIILIGIIAGIVCALGGVALFGRGMIHVEWLGDLFLNALKMLIVPLVMSSIIVGISSLGDVRKLGRIGGLTLGYYAVTTGLAVLIGILLVNLVQPGRGMDLAGVAAPDEALQAGTTGFTDIVLSLVSDNLIRAMAELDILPIIVFSLLLGGTLTTLGMKGRPVIDFFDALNEALMRIVHLLMFAAPLGIFGLVAGRFARAEDLGEVMRTMGWYSATVLLGLMIHALIVLPAILWFFGRCHPFRYMARLSTAVLTAFSTASSSATLPVTIECVERDGEVSRRVGHFVLPLGATVNMDGTALYESVAAIFIAQVAGVDLTFTQQVLVFVTATLAAIGAAGIPEAGLVTMVIVLTAVGLPMEGLGLILAVDWLLDRFRTATNVWGDACGARVIERLACLEPETSRERDPSS